MNLLSSKELDTKNWNNPLFAGDPHHNVCRAVALGFGVAGWRICNEIGGVIMMVVSVFAWVLVIMLSIGWSVFVALSYQFNNDDITMFLILVNIVLIAVMAIYIINSTGWLNQVL